MLRRDTHSSPTTTEEVRAFLYGPDPLIVTKANAKSVVHRRAYLDYVGVKTFDAKGKLAGELRIVGLFTSTAYTRSVMKIPYLRSKAETVIQKLGFDPHDHSGKALINVLESYPRDELFQIAAADPAQACRGDPRPCRPAARARAGARRPVRSFRLRLGLRAARPLRFRRAREDRRLSEDRL